MTYHHKISRAIFDVQYESASDAVESHFLLGGIGQNLLMPVVEEVFNSLSSDAVTIKINRLDLDLGSILSHQIEDELPKRLREKLYGLLSEKIKLIQGQRTPENNNEGIFRKRGITKEDFLFFLKNGFYPENLVPFDLTGLDSKFSEMIQREASVLKEFLIRHKQDPLMIQRLVYQFSEKTLFELLTILNQQGVTSATGFLKSLKSYFLENVISSTNQIESEIIVKEMLIGYFLNKSLRDIDAESLSESLLVFISRNSSVKNRDSIELLRTFLEKKSNYKSEEVRADSKVILQNRLSLLLFSQNKDDVEPIKAASIKDESFQTLLNKIMTRNPEILVDLMKTFKADTRKYKTLKKNLSFQDIQNLIFAFVKLRNSYEKETLEDFKAAVQYFSSMTDDKIKFSYVVLEHVINGDIIDFEKILDELFQSRGLTNHSERVDAEKSLNPVLNKQKKVVTVENCDRHLAENMYETLRLILFTGKVRAQNRLSQISGGVVEVFYRCIDTLCERFPEVLFRLYKELQDQPGKIYLIRSNLNHEQLFKLITVYFKMKSVYEKHEPAFFLESIAQTANQIDDKSFFYSEILTMLLTNQLIDLEILANNKPVHKNHSGHELYCGEVLEVLSGQLFALSEQGSSQGLNKIMTEIKQFELDLQGDFYDFFKNVLKRTSSSTIREKEIAVSMAKTFIKNWLENDDDSIKTTSFIEIKVIKGLIATVSDNDFNKYVQQQLHKEQFLKRFSITVSSDQLSNMIDDFEPDRFFQVQRYVDIFRIAVKSNNLSDLMFNQEAINEFLLRCIQSCDNKFNKTLLFDEKVFLTGLVSHLAKKIKGSTEEFFSHLKENILEAFSPQFALSEKEKIVTIISELQKTEPGLILQELVSDVAEVCLNSSEYEVSGFENIDINTAGLVLTAPYLNRFFEMSGLLEKGGFIDNRAAEKAVHLLSYTATGKDNPFEHLLVLNKILCGIPLERPVRKTIALTQQDKQRAEGLISGMIQNWSILKNTSIDGFRDSFLKRKGTLTFKDDTWYLTVEERAFDMLLDQLPWSFTTIKYSWMESLLRVSWR